MTARTAVIAEANLAGERRLQHLLARAGCEPIPTVAEDLRRRQVSGIEVLIVTAGADEPSG